MKCSSCGTTFMSETQQSKCPTCVEQQQQNTSGGGHAGCGCGQGCAILDERYGIEPGQVTAGLAQLLALSGIDKSFEEGQACKHG